MPTLDALRRRSAKLLVERPAWRKPVAIRFAYIEGEPASYGRIYFSKAGEFAGIYGGNTMPRHRNKGVYISIVAARLREALDRKYKYVTVDALPTSEPILRKRGFKMLTYTQPFLYGHEAH